MKAEGIYTRITFEGPLSDADKSVLKQFRSSELFRVVRKLCAEQYAIVGDKMASIRTSEDLHHAQGQLLGIKAIYNMLLFHSSDLDVAGEAARKTAKK